MSSGYDRFCGRGVKTMVDRGGKVEMKCCVDLPVSQEMSVIYMSRESVI